MKNVSHFVKPNINHFAKPNINLQAVATKTFHEIFRCFNELQLNFVTTVFFETGKKLAQLSVSIENKFLDSLS